MSRLDRHVGAVQRKLALGTFVQALAWAAVALAAGGLLCVLASKVKGVPKAPPLALWASLGAAVMAAVAWALWRTPNARHAAVAIDEKLGLKEKFSTALYARRSQDVFAQAAVRDAEATAERVNLAGQFRMAMPRQGFWAVGLVVLALVVHSIDGQIDPFNRKEAEKRAAQQLAAAESAKAAVRDALAQVKAIEQKVPGNEAVEMTKRVLEPLNNDAVKDPNKTKMEVAQALQDLRDALKNEAKKVEQVQQQAQKDANRMFDQAQPKADDKGPVAEARREIAKGDFAKAMDEVARAVDDFEKMDKKDQKAQADQMKELAKQLENIANDPNVQKQIQQQLQQQLQQAGQNQQQAQQNAQQMANLMKQAAGGNAQAQQQLQQMANQLAQQMKNNPQAQQQLQQALAQAQAQANAQCNAGQMSQAAQQLAQAMQQAAQGNNPGQGQQGGSNMGQAQQAMKDAMENALSQMSGAAGNNPANQAAQQAQNAAANAAGQCQGQGQWDQPGDPNKQGQGQGGEAVGQGQPRGKSPAPFDTVRRDAAVKSDSKGEILSSTLLQDGKWVKGENVAKLREIAAAAERDQTSEVEEMGASKNTARVIKDYFGRVVPEEKK